MTKRTLGLSIITCIMLVIFYAISFYIGQQQFAFAAVAISLLSVSMLSYVKTRAGLRDKSSGKQAVFGKVSLDTVSR